MALRAKVTGAWCGYVGVPKEHPLYGILDGDMDFSVHGGITWAASSDKLDREEWEKAKQCFERCRKEAQKHEGTGDHADHVRFWQDSIYNYDDWREKSRDCCHCVLDPDADQDLWWIGFDCGHSEDMMPALDATLAQIRKLDEPCHNSWQTYRNLTFVVSEVMSLAKQIAQRAAVQ